MEVIFEKGIIPLKMEQYLNSEDFNSECERLAFNFGFVIETLRPLLIDSSD